MFAYFYSTIPWAEVAKRTIKEISDDNCLGLAAQLSFYFLLAVFPALLFFVALLGYLPIDNLMESVLAALGTLAPTELVHLLRGQLTEIAGGRHASLLTIGIVGAISSSSAAMVAISMHSTAPTTLSSGGPDGSGGSWRSSLPSRSRCSSSCRCARDRRRRRRIDDCRVARSGARRRHCMGHPAMAGDGLRRPARDRSGISLRSNRPSRWMWITPGRWSRWCCGS